MTLDKMIFQDVEFDVFIGFYTSEQKERQKITFGFEASLPPISKEHRDDPKFIVLDYATAYKMLSAYFLENRFKLIEAAAEGAAELLMKNFNIHDVTVSFKKMPKDLPQGVSVIYRCHRSRSEVL